MLWEEEALIEWKLFLLPNKQQHVGRSAKIETLSELFDV